MTILNPSENFTNLIQAQENLLKETGWRKRDLPNLVGQFFWSHPRDDTNFVDTDGLTKVRNHIYGQPSAYYFVDLHIRVTGKQTEQEKHLHSLVARAEEVFLLEKGWVKKDNPNPVVHKYIWNNPAELEEKWIGQSEAAGGLIYNLYDSLWDLVDRQYVPGKSSI